MKFMRCDLFTRFFDDSCGNPSLYGVGMVFAVGVFLWLFFKERWRLCSLTALAMFFGYGPGGAVVTLVLALVFGRGSRTVSTVHYTPSTSRASSSASESSDDSSELDRRRAEWEYERDQDREREAREREAETERAAEWREERREAKQREWDDYYEAKAQEE